MKAGIVALVAIPVLAIGLCMSLLMGLFGLSATASSCGAVSSTSGAVTDAIAGFSGDQLTNAAAIINVAAQRQLPVQAAVIAVMTAIGESNLKNINYGDFQTSGVRNPDGTPTTSLGLFQQQDSWGTAAQRLDPATAAGFFFDRLVRVAGWQSLAATIAAHDVQRNANANYYAKYETAAQQIVTGLTGNAAGSASSCNSNSSYTPAAGTAPGAWGGYQNGRIPTSALAAITWADTKFGSNLLRPDALAALEQLDAAFKAQFGYDIPINDGYRDYAGQVAAQATYGSRVATPGTTSAHGWALAIDVADRSHGLISASSPTFIWLNAGAARYGWRQAAWAVKGGSGPYEPWDWQYWGVAS